MEPKFYVKIQSDDSEDVEKLKLSLSQLLEKFPWLAPFIAGISSSNYFTMKWTIDLVSVEVYLIS